VAKDGANKTGIVYGANLNFKIIKPHLERLKKAGLIKQEDKVFKTTEKGFEYLETLTKIFEIMRP